MRIAIGCDHGGLVLKPAILEYLQQKGIEYVDYGTYTDASVDYPDYAVPVAKAVQEGTADKGILMCGTGIGITIAANKFDGIRAAVVSDEFCAAATAEHNNANICAIPARFISVDLAKQVVDTFLSTGFEGGRHQRRIDKIPVKH